MRYLTCLVFGLLLAGGVWAEGDEARVLAQLREQGQFRTAEEFALTQWNREDLPARERAELAIQRALLYTDWALAAAPDSRDELWAKAEEACTDLIEGWPENPRQRLVEVQRGLVSLARGAFERRAGRSQRAVEYLRAALRRLTEVSNEVDRELIELRLRADSNRPPDALSVAELESLANHLSLQVARCQRQLGLCYPPHSPDRDDALLQAVRRLTPLTRRTPADELTWNARVELAAALSELGRSNAASQAVREWLEEKPPAPIAARLEEESGEDATVIASGRWQENAVGDANISGEEFDPALQAAANSREAGRQAEASEQFRRIALRQPGDPRAPAAHQQAILAMANVMRGAASEQQSAFAATYLSLLKEHLANWPAQVPADEVRLWLGQFLAARGEWAAAISELEQVRPNSTSYSDSVKWVGRGYDALLREADEGLNATDDDRRAQLLAAATRFLQPIITGTDNRWPDPWSTLQLETAVQLARLHLRHSEMSSQYAERLLTAALQSRSSESTNPKVDDWEPRARLLLVEALVRNDKTVAAQTTIEPLTAVPLSPLLETLAALDAELTRDAEHASGANHKLAELSLGLVGFAERQLSDLAPETRRQLNAWRAGALAAEGDRAAALALYAGLAAQQPDNGRIQERYAALLAESDSAAELRQALERWEKVESRSRRGGKRWRRARRARIDLFLRLGDEAEAEKLLRLTVLLYPDWERREQRTEKSEATRR